MDKEIVEDMIRTQAFGLGNVCDDMTKAITMLIDKGVVDDCGLAKGIASLMFLKALLNSRFGDE